MSATPKERTAAASPSWSGTWERAAVLGLTLLALGLRAWGIQYGFPQPWTRPDEERWVRIGLGILEDPNPHWFQWPSLHAYLLAAVYWLWGRFRLLRGDYPTWHAYLNEDPSVYPVDLVLLGRLFSALTGALAVPLMWRLGERVGPRGSGLLAAGLLAVSFGPVRDAHWALIEALLLSGILATLVMVAWAVERPALRHFAAAGLAAGLTTSAKYSAMTLAAPIALAVLLARRREGRSITGTLLDTRGLAAAAAMVVGFLAVSPFVLVSRRQFLADMAIREWSYRDASFGTDIGFVHHALFSLRHSHGLPLEVAGILGLFLFGFRNPGRATVVIYAVATYIALGPARIIPMRYASNLAPAIVLGAAWAVFAAARGARRRGLVVGVSALALAANPLYRDVRMGMLLAREDTRVSARRWLDMHLVPGEGLMARDSKALRWGRPLMEDRYRVMAYNDALARQGAAPWVVLSESPTGYVPWAPEVHALMRGIGTIAAVFDPFSPAARPVYDPHDAFFVPVAGFEGVRAPGPRITIYRLAPRPEPQGPSP